MTKKFLYGGGVFLLLLFFLSFFVFYRNSNQEHEHFPIKINVKKEKNELFYSLLLKNGYLSVTYSKMWSYFGGIKVSKPALELKEGAFSLKGKSKIGFLSKKSFIFNDFSGNICDNFKIKAKRVFILIYNSQVKSIKIKKFTIENKNLFIFSQKQKLININTFCSNPIEILSRDNK